MKKTFLAISIAVTIGASMCVSAADFMMTMSTQSVDEELRPTHGKNNVLKGPYLSLAECLLVARQTVQIWSGVVEGIEKPFATSAIFAHCWQKYADSWEISETISWENADVVRANCEKDLDLDCEEVVQRVLSRNREELEAE